MAKNQIKKTSCIYDSPLNGIKRRKKTGKLVFNSLLF